MNRRYKAKRLLPGNMKGGAFSILIIGLAVSFAALLILLNAADFAVYAYKRNIISTALDYGVSAAIQEIDEVRSRAGLSEGFDANGNMSMDNIFIHEQRADQAFYDTFRQNSGISKGTMENHIMIAVANPITSGLNYIVKRKASRIEGNVNGPQKLQEILNNQINSFWNSGALEADRHVIYVNGNLKTNEFEKRPYYMVFIRDYQIDGLFRRRTATFVGFKGAKVQRQIN